MQSHGNGESRKETISLENLKTETKCNRIYEEGRIDNLVCVDYIRQQSL